MLEGALASTRLRRLPRWPMVAIRMPAPKRLFCEQPDRDEPRIQCGYPLPCPHHTVISEPGRLRVPKGVSAKTRRRVKRLHAIIQEKK